MLPRTRRIAVAMPALMMLSLLVSTAPARADDLGALGAIVVVARNSLSADTYLQYHGRMVVGDPIGGYAEYRWGGTSCGSRTLTETQVAELQAAMNNPRILVQPLSQPGQGQTICLVGYSFVLRSETGALP